MHKHFNKDPYKKIEPLRQQNLGKPVGAFMVGLITYEQLPWHETDEDQELALRKARIRDEMLKWIRKEMRGRLKKIERRSIELYYFRDLRYREAAIILGVNQSTVCRAVKRGIKKLQRAAERNEIIWPDPAPMEREEDNDFK